MTFPSKTPDETKLLTFDFTPEAVAGTVLSNPVIGVLVVSGEGDPTDLIIGTPTVADALDDGGTPIAGRESQWVKVMVGSGLDGVKYRISCEADADNGEHHRIDKDLPIKEKAALVP